MTSKSSGGSAAYHQTELVARSLGYAFYNYGGFPKWGVPPDHPKFWKVEIGDLSCLETSETSIDMWVKSIKSIQAKCWDSGRVNSCCPEGSPFYLWSSIQLYGKFNIFDVVFFGIIRFYRCCYSQHVTCCLNHVKPRYPRFLAQHFPIFPSIPPGLHQQVSQAARHRLPRTPQHLTMVTVPTKLGAAHAAPIFGDLVG